MPRSPSVSEKTDRRGIQSIEVGVKVLEALASTEGAAPLKLISDLAGMSPSKAHRYLSSFVRTGLVRQDAGTGHYDLARLSLRIGLAALARVDIIKLAEQVLADLTAETGITSVLSIWSERGPVIVRWQRSSPPLITSMSIGTLAPVLASATGRVFLAYMPPAATRSLVSAERSSLRRAGRTPYEDLASLLAEVRRDGTAHVDGDVVPGLRALAGAVFDAGGSIAATITLLSADQHLVEPGSQARLALVRACRSLSTEAGAPAAALPPEAAASPPPRKRAPRSAGARTLDRVAEL